MKSSPQGLKITTSCKNCTFSEFNQMEGLQDGCRADRLSKFKLEDVHLNTDEDNGYFEIGRVCNMHRDRDDNPYITIEEAREEIEPTFGIVIYDDPTIETNLKDCIDSIMNLDYDKNKITVVISSFSSKNVSQLVDLINKLKTVYKRASLSLNTHTVERMIDYDGFSKCADRNYLIKMNYQSTISPQTLRRVDEILNDELLQIIAFQADGENKEPITILPKRVVSSEYLKYNSFNKMALSMVELTKINGYYQYIS